VKTFRHNFRVFEVAHVGGAQMEVVLVSMIEPASDRRRADRVSTGQAMGKIRFVVDMRFVDTFAVGKQFSVEITEKVA
jgi:hypothetical protein